jgi:DNA-binding transcriptional regulator YiaG
VGLVAHGDLILQRKRGYPSTPNTSGEEILKRRLNLNLQQIDVAKIIGCDQMTVVNWEKG